MLTLPVYNIEGKEIETIELDASIFGAAVNQNAIHQVVVGYRANQRKGQAATKTRGEVSGSGVKPYRQKGTGRARAGSIRSPLWHHGGVVFGPHPRDYSYTVPKKLKILALKSALCARIKEAKFSVLDNLILETSKTKEAAKIFLQSKIKPHPESILLLLDKLDKNLRLALRNIDFLRVNLAKNTNAYEVLAAQKVIITKGALQQLSERLKE